MARRMTSEELLQISIEIRNSMLRPVEKKPYFTEKYPEFAESYPQLFQMAIDPSADFNHITFLMQQLKAVETKKASFRDASVTVGEVFAAKYVTPIVERLDAERERQ